MAMDRLKKKYQIAWTYLSELNPSLWSRSAFTFSSKCDLLTNNCCESFNKWILKAREKPIIMMVDMIRKQLTKRLQEKKENEEKFKPGPCPRILEKMAMIRREARDSIAMYAGNDQWEVSWKDERFEVDLSKMTCGCRMWQLSGIPCKHAYEAIRKQRKNPEDFVDPVYHKEAYLKAYQGMIHPIPDSCHWPKTQMEKIEPPKWKRMPGRPKKKRRKGADELEQRPNVGCKQRCGKCKEWGHNKRSCQNQDFVKVPSGNRGGRPPTHGRYARGSIGRGGVTSHTSLSSGIDEGSSGGRGRGRRGRRPTLARREGGRAGSQSGRGQSQENVGAIGEGVAFGAFGTVYPIPGNTNSGGASSVGNVGSSQ